MDKHVLATRDKCIKKSAVNKEETKLILSGKGLTKDSTVANTSITIQCYFYCLLEEFSLFKDGKPIKKALAEKLSLLINDKKKANAALDKCSKLEGKNVCQVGFSFILCVLKEVGQLIF